MAHSCQKVHFSALLFCIPFSSAERFVLDPALVEEYRHKKPPFGFNGLGEVVYLRTYAREKDNGQSEVWLDTVQRVVTGTFEVLQHHVVNKLHCHWDAQKVFHVC